MIKKLKKIGALVLGLLVTLKSKVLGANIILDNIILDMRAVPMYGIEQPPSVLEKTSPFLVILGAIFIPIIFIIGLAVYVKKNKRNSEKAKKVKIAKNIYQALIIITVILFLAMILFQKIFSNM